MTETQTRRAPRTETTAPAFTDEERAAMKARAAELKAAAKRGGKAAKEDGEAVVDAGGKRVAPKPG